MHDEYEVITEGVFSGSTEFQRQLLSSLPEFELSTLDKHSRDWLLRSHSPNPRPAENAASLLEAISNQKATMHRLGDQCQGITIGTFSPMGMTGVHLTNRSLKQLDDLDINLSIQLACYDPPNVIKDPVDFVPREDTNVEVGVSFRGFSFDPDVITERLQTEPVTQSRVGDFFSKDRRCMANYWYDSYGSDEETPNDLICGFLEKMERRWGSIIDELGLRKYGTLRIGVFQPYPPDDYCRLSISRKALQSVASAGVDFEFSMYFHSDPTSEDDE